MCLADTLDLSVMGFLTIQLQKYLMETEAGRSMCVCVCVRACEHYAHTGSANMKNGLADHGLKQAKTIREKYWFKTQILLY